MILNSIHLWNDFLEKLWLLSTPNSPKITGFHLQFLRSPAVPPPSVVSPAGGRQGLADLHMSFLPGEALVTSLISHLELCSIGFSLVPPQHVISSTVKIPS